MPNFIEKSEFGTFLSMKSAHFLDKYANRFVIVEIEIRQVKFHLWCALIMFSPLFVFIVIQMHDKLKTFTGKSSSKLLISFCL